MDRPQSINLFDKAFLAAVAVSAVGMVLFFDSNLRAVQADPAFAQTGLGGGFIVGVGVLSVAIMLLLWFFISRKASNIAKWLVVALTVIGLPSGISGITTSSGLQLLLGVVTLVLQIAAVVLLFRADSRAWFANKGRPTVDAATFD